MTINMEKYMDLKTHFVHETEPHTLLLLSLLKDKYSQEIGSKRILDSIDDIGKFLRILEKRDILCFSNVRVLKDSALYLRDTELVKRITLYENWYSNIGYSTINDFYQHGKLVKDTEIINRVIHSEDADTCFIFDTDKLTSSMTSFVPCSLKPCTFHAKLKVSPRTCIYVTAALAMTIAAFLFATYKFYDNVISIKSLAAPEKSIVTPASFQPNASTHQPQMRSNRSTGKDFIKEKEFQQDVLMNVSGKLGRHWTDVARLLRISEYEIDELETKYRYNMKECAFQALKLFADRGDANWGLTLMNALDRARRRDLRDFVHDLLLNRKS